MRAQVLKGSVLVGLGASCYGMLATFVKLAYLDGYSTAEVTLSQFSLGFAGLLIINLLAGRGSLTATPVKTSGTKSVFRLILAGTSLGLTSIFYYISVQYVPVSVGIVLLMQTVWMGVVVEMAVHKKAPGLVKLASVMIVLAGTVLATGLFGHAVAVSWTGFGWGIMAAVCYTATMFSSNRLELHFPPMKRSLFLILGGLVVIVLIYHTVLNRNFSYGIFTSWGLLLSLFGTVLPPLLFTRGMPLTGMGLGAVIAAVEIPVAILTASVLLKEPVALLQWLGVCLILLAVVLMNIKKSKSPL